MNFFKNRRNAIIITAVIVLLSLIFGTFRSVTALKGDIERTFAAGIKGDGMSIQSDLNERNKIASNFLVVAKRYLEDGDETILKVKSAQAALTGAGRVSEKFKANEVLKEAVDELFDKLGTLKLSASDVKYRANLKDEMDGRMRTISHDGYNDKATEFNENVLNSFPVNIIRRILAISDIELFK